MRQLARMTGLLMPLARSWRRAVDAALMPLGLSEALAGPIIYLGRSRPGISQNELAAMMSIGAPSLVRAIDRLVAAGLVERRVDDSDKRVRRLYLTEGGASLAARMEQVLDSLRQDVLSGIPAEELQICRDVLERIDAALLARAGGAVDFQTAPDGY